MYAYTYPTSSQLLMTGQHPSSATTCCETTPTTATGGGGMTPDPQQAAQSAAAAAAAVCSLPAAAYDSRLLSSYPRLATGLHAAAVNGFYGAAAAAYPDQTSYVTAALGTNASAFYSSLPSPYDLKDGRGAWGTLPQAAAAACYPYDPMGAYGPYGDRYGAIDNAARRKNATRETTNTLKAWLYEHRKNPYPTKGEKIMLAIITKMTLTQVSTWFANARRRLKKENKMTWEPRNKTNDGADGDDKSDNSGDEDSSMTDKRPTGSGSKHDEDLSRDSTDFKIHPNRVHPTSSSPENSSSSADCVNPLIIPMGPHSLHLQQQRLLLRDSRMHGGPPVSGLHLAASRHSAFVQASGGVGGGIIPNHGAMRTSPTPCHTVENNRPKIWSLAHTATSDSPPPVRKSPLIHHSPSSSLGTMRPEYGDPKYVKSETGVGMYCGVGSLSDRMYRDQNNSAGEIDIKPPMAHHDPLRGGEQYSHLNGVSASKNWLNGGLGHLSPAKNCSAPSSTSQVGIISAFDPSPMRCVTSGTVVRVPSPAIKDPRMTPGSNSCSSIGSSSGTSTPPYAIRSMQEESNPTSAPRPYCDIGSGLGATAVAYDLHHESHQPLAHHLQPSTMTNETSFPSLMDSSSCSYRNHMQRSTMDPLTVVTKNTFDNLPDAVDTENTADSFGRFSQSPPLPSVIVQTLAPLNTLPMNSCAESPSAV